MPRRKVWRLIWFIMSLRLRETMVVERKEVRGNIVNVPMFSFVGQWSDDDDVDDKILLANFMKTVAIENMVLIYTILSKTSICSFGKTIVEKKLILSPSNEVWSTLTCKYGVYQHAVKYKTKGKLSNSSSLTKISSLSSYSINLWQLVCNLWFSIYSLQLMI